MTPLDRAAAAARTAYHVELPVPDWHTVPDIARDRWRAVAQAVLDASRAPAPAPAAVLFLEPADAVHQDDDTDDDPWAPQ